MLLDGGDRSLLISGGTCSHAVQLLIYQLQARHEGRRSQTGWTTPFKSYRSSLLDFKVHKVTEKLLIRQKGTIMITRHGRVNLTSSQSSLAKAASNPLGKSRLPSDTVFVESSRVSIPNRTSIRSAVFV